jgi:hypothetical protein
MWVLRFVFVLDAELLHQVEDALHGLGFLAGELLGGFAEGTAQDGFQVGAQLAGVLRGIALAAEDENDIGGLPIAEKVAYG